MAATTIRIMDGIVLFLIFSFSAAALITAVSVLGYGILLEAALPVALAGGLSAGCLVLFFGRLLDARATGTLPVQKSNRVAGLSSEMERAGRSITSG